MMQFSSYLKYELSLGKTLCSFRKIGLNGSQKVLASQHHQTRTLTRNVNTQRLFFYGKKPSSSLFREQLNSGSQLALLKPFSTMNIMCNENKDKDVDEKTSEKPLSQRQKLARIFAAYGTTAVVFHTSISLTSLGICYMVVSSGVDMVAILQKVGIASEAGLQSTFATGASTFVIAYACHKVFMPVRIFLTVTCTPVIVGKLRSIGILKDKAVKQKA